MARPTQASTENKKKYAYAVLSGSMTRKDAYLKYINPYCTTPVKSAAQLHKTKTMLLLLEEVSAELNDIATIKQTTKDIVKEQLTLAQMLLKDVDDKPHKEKLALLKSIKSVQDNAMATLQRIDSDYTGDNDSVSSVSPSTCLRQGRAAKYIH